MTDFVDLIAPIIITLLTGTLFGIFTYKRGHTSIHALDWLMAVFGSTALLGIFQIIKVFDPTLGIYADLAVEPGSADITVVINLIILIILYFMSENFINDRPNTYRLVTITALSTIFLMSGIFYAATGTVIRTHDVLPFMHQNDLFDGFIFDLMQVLVISFLFYVFYLQYKLTEFTTLKQYLLFLLAGIALYLGASLIELSEHFIGDQGVNAFVSSVPAFVILAIFYIRNPNFVYLAPVNIAFLQIVSSDGSLLYAAEMKDELNTTDFLVGPSLTSVSTIISELVNNPEDRKRVEIKQFVYDGGYILFEQVGEIRAILQSDRPATILKRSMRYFLREFWKLYESQILNYKGYIEAADGITPDDVFSSSIPIVQSKAMTSSFSKSTPA